MGIGTAVTFVVGKGDSLSTSERIGLSQGKIPDAYAEEGFWRLLNPKSLPKIENDEDKRNFCFFWFYAGIGVAIAYMEREQNK